MKVGNVQIGNGAPIVVQTMCKTNTRHAKDTLAQIKELAKAGAKIVRLAIPDEEAVFSFGKIASKSPVPLVADIHFDYRLALEAIAQGASKIRFNPGNIGQKENLLELVQACKTGKIPIRIGVNAGSLEKEFTEPSPENLVASALKHAQILEEADFQDICLSIKSSDVQTTIQANRLLKEKTNYPLHIGLTEAGVPEVGKVKSAVALGTLLAEGIGDTIRVSLTANPVEEVRVAYEILDSLGLSRQTRNFVSCPGCGRTEASHWQIAQEVFAKTQNLDPRLTIAVMGCAVNGPGEASHADFALVAGKKHYALYAQGEFVRTVAEQEAVQAFLDLIHLS